MEVFSQSLQSNNGTIVVCLVETGLAFVVSANECLLAVVVDTKRVNPVPKDKGVGWQRHFVGTSWSCTIP